MQSVASIIQTLKERGLRQTAARTALIETLAERHEPRSAGDLLAALVARKLLVNKTTLYRELEFLRQQGIVTDVRLNERQIRYELAGEHHHHLVCTSCDRIEDVVLDRDLESEERRIERTTRFKIQRHVLEFFGVCAKCRA